MARNFFVREQNDENSDGSSDSILYTAISFGHVIYYIYYIPMFCFEVSVHLSELSTNLKLQLEISNVSNLNYIVTTDKMYAI